MQRIFVGPLSLNNARTEELALATRGEERTHTLHPCLVDYWLHFTAWIAKAASARERERERESMACNPLLFWKLKHTLYEEILKGDARAERA